MFSVQCWAGVTVLLTWATVTASGADNAAELLGAARAALTKGNAKEALKLADKAVAAEPKDPQAYFVRGVAHEALNEHREAVTDFSKVIDLDPKTADAYNHRGSERFKLGQITESLADFDRFLELRPGERPGHWKRGIVLYYAGRFDEGAKQFAAYEKVDTNDVENAVWHFLCVARASGVEKARTSLLKIGHDRRVPLMQVYDLFAGRLKPEDVLAAVQAGKPTAEQLEGRLFYAHLYLGLYYEATGDKKKALEHMTKADEQKLGGYMWDVAHVHWQLLQK